MKLEPPKSFEEFSAIRRRLQSAKDLENAYNIAKSAGYRTEGLHGIDSETIFAAQNRGSLDDAVSFLDRFVLHQYVTFLLILVTLVSGMGTAFLSLASKQAQDNPNASSQQILESSPLSNLPMYALTTTRIITVLASIASVVEILATTLRELPRDNEKTERGVLMRILKSIAMLSTRRPWRCGDLLIVVFLVVTIASDSNSGYQMASMLRLLRLGDAVEMIRTSLAKEVSSWVVQRQNEKKLSDSLSMQVENLQVKLDRSEASRKGMETIVSDLQNELEYHRIALEVAAEDMARITQIISRLQANKTKTTVSASDDNADGLFAAGPELTAEELETLSKVIGRDLNSLTPSEIDYLIEKFSNENLLPESSQDLFPEETGAGSSSELSDFTDDEETKEDVKPKKPITSVPANVLGNRKVQVNPDGSATILRSK